jgi:hypothetical protein
MIPKDGIIFDHAINMWTGEMRFPRRRPERTLTVDAALKAARAQRASSAAARAAHPLEKLIPGIGRLP